MGTNSGNSCFGSKTSSNSGEQSACWIRITKLNKMPGSLSSTAEALTAFRQIISAAKESPRKILLRGEFDENSDEKRMHCKARLAEEVLEEVKGIGLPNFLPRTAFLTILQRTVKGISNKPAQFIGEVSDYLEEVVITALMYHSDNYPQLQSSTIKAAHNLISKMKDQSFNRVMKISEMEKLTDYTCNQEYKSEWNKLVSLHDNFINEVFSESKPGKVKLGDLGGVVVGSLRQYHDVTNQSFDLKMRRIKAYRKIKLAQRVEGYGGTNHG
ncbi:hypothetical protein CRYUN_Cryun08bG0064800 [Craigia yunnanensis]